MAHHESLNGVNLLTSPMSLSVGGSLYLSSYPLFKSEYWSLWLSLFPIHLNNYGDTFYSGKADYIDLLHYTLWSKYRREWRWGQVVSRLALHSGGPVTLKEDRQSCHPSTLIGWWLHVKPGSHGKIMKKIQAKGRLRYVKIMKSLKNLRKSFKNRLKITIFKQFSRDCS